ncbi:MAG: hypothetical protein SPL50_04980 [Alloprevotella sp.]|nr:hypothetical protein [Alloprevotella sp.]
MIIKKIMCLASLCILMLASCSSNEDRVQHEIDRYNKTLSKKPKELGNGLTLDSVWRTPDFVVMEVGYKGDNEPFALQIIDQTRDDFRQLYVGTLNNDTKRSFTDAGLGIRVVVTGKRTRQKVSIDVPYDTLKAGL